MPKKMNNTRPPWNIPDEWAREEIGCLFTDLMEAGVFNHDTALTMTWFTRWTDEWCIDCSHCGKVDEHYSVEDFYVIEEFSLSWRHKCKSCGKKFSVTSGTWISSHKLPIEYWWRIAYVLGDLDIKVTSHWLDKDLKVTQMTAYYSLIVVAKALGVSLRTPLKIDKGMNDIMSALLTVRK